MFSIFPEWLAAIFIIKLLIMMWCIAGQKIAVHKVAQRAHKDPLPGSIYTMLDSSSRKSNKMSLNHQTMNSHRIICRKPLINSFKGHLFLYEVWAHWGSFGDTARILWLYRWDPWWYHEDPLTTRTYQRRSRILSYSVCLLMRARWVTESCIKMGPMLEVYTRRVPSHL